MTITRCPGWLASDVAEDITYLNEQHPAAVRKEVIEVYMGLPPCHLELTEPGRDALPNFGNPANAIRASYFLYLAKRTLLLSLQMRLRVDTVFMRATEFKAADA